MVRTLCGKCTTQTKVVACICLFAWIYSFLHPSGALRVGGKVSGAEAEHKNFTVLSLLEHLAVRHTGCCWRWAPAHSSIGLIAIMFMFVVIVEEIWILVLLLVIVCLPHYWLIKIESLCNILCSTCAMIQSVESHNESKQNRSGIMEGRQWTVNCSTTRWELLNRETNSFQRDNGRKPECWGAGWRHWRLPCPQSSGKRST